MSFVLCTKMQTYAVCAVYTNADTCRLCSVQKCRHMLFVLCTKVQTYVVCAVYKNADACRLCFVQECRHMSFVLCTTMRTREELESEVCVCVWVHLFLLANSVLPATSSTHEALNVGSEFIYRSCMRAHTHTHTHTHTHAHKYTHAQTHQLGPSHLYFYYSGVSISNNKYHNFLHVLHVFHTQLSSRTSWLMALSVIIVISL